MIRMTHSIRVRLCMPVDDQQPHELGVADDPHERPGHLVVQAVGVLQALLVAGQRGPVAAGQGHVHGLGGHAAGLVGVGDALAVEGVDGPAGVAHHQVGGARVRADGQAHRAAGPRSAGRSTSPGDRSHDAGAYSTKLAPSGGWC